MRHRAAAATDSGDESISSIEPFHRSNSKQSSSVYGQSVRTTAKSTKKSVSLIMNPVTWTSSTPVMHKLASNDVYTNNNNEILVDCTINEETSSENAEASSCHNDFDSDTGEEDEDYENSNNTTNLVEDGFIRMSSPVDNDLIDLDSVADSLTQDATEMNQLSAELCQVFEKSKINNQGLVNFPNVGTSPVSEEFNESDSGGENAGEEEEDELEALDGQSYDVNESFSDERQDFDGIILLGGGGENVESLSDVEVGGDVVEAVARPQGIMKSTVRVQEAGGSSSSASSSPGSAVVVVKEEKKVAQTGAGVQKPKVRFNLDIDYEKEREWNRVNRIIGDASKSQIEWTQEVEV